MSFLLAFFGFAVLIVLHEFGHFVAAKAVGMRVERFALFFPPLAARYRPKGSETEYAIGLIPLGGYVKITGMSPLEDIAPEVEHRAYYKQAVWKRVVTIFAGPLVNIVLAFVILWGIFAFNGEPVRETLGVGIVSSDTAADGVLREDDRILAIDGVRGFEPGLSEAETLRRAERLRAQINEHRCQGGRAVDGCRAAEPARFTLLRDGERLVVSVTPRYEVEERRMLAGFSFGAVRFEDAGVGESASLAVTGLWNVSTLTVERLVALVYDSEARDEVSGVVGSYEATRQSFEFDTVQAIQILALISLSLGIINLFPFLPLDGGHIFWALAEKVRRRPIAFATMEKASFVGIALILMLFFIGFSNDIGRITSDEGFGVR